jgi:tetratricopeptide (TPR) repeat protein
MHIFPAILIVLALAFGAAFADVSAQEINLMPKYGLLPKTKAQQEIDANFLASIDKQYKGNRKKAAQDFTARGWQYLTEGNFQDARRRFNQAWLLDPANGTALWGMAAIQSMEEKFDEVLKLFAEAEALVSENHNLTTDYAKTQVMAWTQNKDEKLLKDAFARFERVYKKAPKHKMNLLNWAIAFYVADNYAEAWKKVKLAEAIKGEPEFAPEFLKMLEGKMPRP